MSEEVKVLSASEKKQEDFMNSKWRPMCAWMYMLVCMMDMVIFPILWALLQTATKSPITQWQPLTLQGAGLFHIAMGAVLGIAAFGRTQEKLGGANNGGMQPVAQSVTTTFGQPQAGGFSNSGGFGSSAPNSFGGNSGFGAPTSRPVNAGPSWGTTPIASRGFGDETTEITLGFGGKKAPPDAPQPLI